MKIQEFAKRCGFDMAEDTEKIWNGYKVYSLDMLEDAAVGLPQFALVKDGKVRVNTYDETFEIYDFVYPPDEEDEEE